MSAFPSSSPGIRAVLRAPRVALLLTASLVGRLPLGSAPLALLLYARQSLSLPAAGLLVAAYTAAMAVSAPVLARGVDRWRQPPVLYGSAALSGIGFLIVAFGGGNLTITLAGAAVAGLGTPPLEACLRALWPDLVSPEAVPAAYALDVAAQEIIFVAGPLVTLGVTAVAGPAAALVTVGLLQFGSVLVFARVEHARNWRGVPAARHWAGPLRAARFVALLAGVVCTGAAVGSIPVAVTGYAEAAGNRSIAGWLLATQAAGALVGGLLYTRARPGGRARLPLLTGALALGYLPLLATPTPAAMAGLVLISGLALPPVLTAVFLAADRLAPAGTTVEAFAWIFTAFAVGSASGSALNGPLTAAGIRYGFVLAPAAALLAVTAMLLACRPPVRPVEHIVWDWNGTIFGDSNALIEATIDAFRACGMPAVTRADYQRHHIQPIPAFYERLAGRPLTDDEQRHLDECFRAAYGGHRAGAALTSDAVPALSRWAATGGRQSLLSMYPHDELVPLVQTAGIAPFFARIDGSTDRDVARKAPHLARHLQRQNLRPARVLLVGDSVDDVRAARECGVDCVIYHPGADALHARGHFTDLDVPLVATLQAAVDYAHSRGSRTGAQRP